MDGIGGPTDTEKAVISFGARKQCEININATVRTSSRYGSQTSKIN
jgi:hypothetical protein